jgi:hypothetical protein
MLGNEFNITRIPMGDPTDVCREGITYSLNCIQKNFCPQFPTYMIQAGIGVILAFILISWLDWWLQNKGGLLWLLGTSRPDLSLVWGPFEIWIPLDLQNPQTARFFHEILIFAGSRALLIFSAFVVMLNLI